MRSVGPLGPCGYPVSHSVDWTRPMVCDDASNSRTVGGRTVPEPRSSEERSVAELSYQQKSKCGRTHPAVRPCRPGTRCLPLCCHGGGAGGRAIGAVSCQCGPCVLCLSELLPINRVIPRNISTAQSAVDEMEERNPRKNSHEKHRPDIFLNVSPDRPCPLRFRITLRAQISVLMQRSGEAPRTPPPSSGIRPGPGSRVTSVAGSVAQGALGQAQRGLDRAPAQRRPDVGTCSRGVSYPFPLRILFSCSSHSPRVVSILFPHSRSRQGLVGKGRPRLSPPREAGRIRGGCVDCRVSMSYCNHLSEVRCPLRLT